MKILVEEEQTLVAANALYARSFLRRGLGLMGKRRFDPYDALVLPRCRCVHMFFMRFPIDVVFLDPDGVILALQENLQPWRMSRFVSKAITTIELPSGRSAECKLSAGLRLQLLE